jgi:CRP/FNR family transcriptional regulator, cyclic AMP receptor protein
MDHGSDGFFESLPPELRKRVQSQVRIVRARRGQTLLGRGASTTDVYFILDGAFSVIIYSASGREVSMRNLVTGDTFGELSAVDGLPRSASVVAETDARLASLRREEFLHCIETSPATAMWLARLLAGKVRDMSERLFEISALNVPARLHCELLRLAKTTPAPDRLLLDPAPTHAELANRIGTHREAVTREIQELVRIDVIRAGRRTLEFLDLPRLEHLVGQAVGELLGREAAA